MKRLAAFLFAIALPASGPVFAGDTASLNVLGFSEDGAVFAFEEYGVQDGSGFSYANRFYIDVKTDKFIQGTPVRVRIDDESAGVTEARAKAAIQGNAVVADDALDEGFTAAANAITELSANPHEVVFLPRPVFPPIDAAIGIRLEEIDFKTSENCLGRETLKGFRLVRFDPQSNGDEAVLSQDSSIPASRICPTGYRIGKVVTHYLPSGSAVFAVLVTVERVGFEGPDHRWIAVTGQME